MMSASLKVKAIWLREGVEEGLKEVRRFRVSDESSGGIRGQCLSSVLHNVHSLFNIKTATQDCTLFWKDEDDDLIQFSSEEELSHAIDSMSDDTLRIYVIITGEGPSAPSCEDCNCPPQESSSSSSFSFSSSSSQAPPPPPPPPPHQEPHSHCPPPPFPGPWAHQGWKKWKPMGSGGWKGGWKGGMYFGCPWNFRHGMQGCGHKGRGMYNFKHGWDKKQKKWMKANRCWMAGAANDQKEFEELLQQVPFEFRSWVRQYMQTWYTQGPEAARAAAPEKLPQNVGEDFPQWLHSYLTRFFPHPCAWGEGQAKEGAEGETGKAPSCLPPVYFRWLSVYVPSFFQRNGHFSFSSSSDGEEDDGSWQWQFHGHGFYPRGFGWKGKHWGCKKMRGGGKHKRRTSCGSDDNDSNGHSGVKVPKQFRKFVRVSFKKLRKGKAENPKIKAKATRAGISAEMQEYVEQVLLEWQAKLTHKNYRTVSKEMIMSDRTLPPGMPRAHFLWMLRFMVHWEERRSGKHNCPSDESSSDDTSGEESASEEQDCGPCPPPPPPPPPFHAPFMGMMGAGPHSFPFPMPSGMEHPFPTPPPPPPMFGCFPPPPPPPGCFPMNPPPYMFSCQDQDQDTANKKTPSSEEMVEQVTEGVKKL